MLPPTCTVAEGTLPQIEHALIGSDLEEVNPRYPFTAPLEKLRQDRRKAGGCLSGT
jgi:hypothetical protein